MEIFTLIDTWRGNEVICVCNTLELAHEAVSEFAEIEEERPDIDPFYGYGRVRIETSKLITS